MGRVQFIFYAGAWHPQDATGDHSVARPDEFIFYAGAWHPQGVPLRRGGETSGCQATSPCKNVTLTLHGFP
jgi:hypothetical protein